MIKLNAKNYLTHMNLFSDKIFSKAISNDRQVPEPESRLYSVIKNGIKSK